MSVSSRILSAFACALIAATLTSCLYIFRTVDVVSVDPSTASPVQIHQPVKVHLNNGNTAVFPDGVALVSETVRGNGQLFGIIDSVAVPVDSMSFSFEDVAAIESFQFRTRQGKTALVSSLATAGALALTPVLLVAIFGSCPTVYSNRAGEEILEAESFPNSIAPLFEMRDIDRIGAQADEYGRIKLSVRNEALETHYINHIELVEAIHASDALLVPTRDGTPVALHNMRSASFAVDRSGRDVTSLLAGADTLIYETLPETSARADSADLWDYIHLDIPVDQNRTSDSAFVYFRLRNSLLGTVFFYDHMLAGQGPRSVKWLADDLEVIGEALALADFYSKRMGLRIDLLVDGSHKEVGRVREVGPIAFDHVAVPIPITGQMDTLRVRLRFVPDAWRIDRVGVSYVSSQPLVRTIPIERVDVPPGISSDWKEMIVEGLTDTDELYAVTGPGQNFNITFDVGEELPGIERTFLIGMQGYYVEWIRGEWLRQNPIASRFKPTDASILQAMRTWSAVKEDFEQRFYSSKIPAAGGPSADD